jgi:hypothetical protein
VGNLGIRRRKQAAAVGDDGFESMGQVFGLANGDKPGIEITHRTAGFKHTFPRR